MFHASHKNADISPTKVRLVTNLIVGKPVGEALEVLKYTPNRGARYVEKVLKSAVANAKEKGAREVESFMVYEARVNEGPRLKRIQPRSRGMAFGILKRLCHIHVGIDS